MSLKTGFLKVWHDPVWSKVISAIILGLISFLFFQISQLFPLLSVEKAITIAVSAVAIILSGYLIVKSVRWCASKKKPEKSTTQKQDLPTAVLDISIPGFISRELLPEIYTADSIELLRQRGGVRPMTSEENQLTLWELSDNIFGYVEAYKLNSPQVQYRMINKLDIEQHFLLNKDLCLHQSAPPTEYAEVHKYKNCSIYLICYVTEEDRIAIQNPSRQQPDKVTVSLNKTQKRNKIIAIPRERLVHWRLRTLGDHEEVADAIIS